MYAWTIPQIYSPLFPLFFLKHITASCLSQTCLNWLKRVLGMGNGGVTKHVSGRAVSKIRKGDWIVWRHSLYQFPELMGNFSFLPCFASRGPGRRRPSSSGAAQGPLRPSTVEVNNNPSPTSCHFAGVSERLSEVQVVVSEVWRRAEEGAKLARTLVG